MAKTVYVCNECGTGSPRWSGKCSGCGAWNSLIEEVTTSGVSGTKKAQALPPQQLSTIELSGTGPRITTGIQEADQVLGGGLVQGSVLLLAGEPGIGKSTLLLQAAAGVAKDKKQVLYISGEESLQQTKLRADRLKVDEAAISLLTVTDIDAIVATILSAKPDFVIIDSIQTMMTEELNSSAGTVSQITAATHKLQRAAKAGNTAILIVGHVTKEGNIAGPKILEHLVDVVLYLEGEKFGGFKLLRGVKNRFGSTNEVGIFEMINSGLRTVKNPSAAFLDERQPSEGSIVFAGLEGTRALLIEVQALVNNSPFGYPKRTAVGFDLNRLNVLVAVLQQRAGVKLADKDIYVNIVGGMRLGEPAADLAVAMAIASAATHKPLKTDAVVFGEVGLSGEVRSVQYTEARIKEAKKLKFTHAIGPKYSSSFIKPVETLREAIRQGLDSVGT